MHPTIRPNSAMMRAMRVEGYVLTGGRSSRFGSDKALHLVGGRAMALHVADALRSLADPVTLVGDPDRYGSLGLPVIPDQMAGAGPLAGIVSALANASTPWVLVAACDMPKLSAAPLASLLAAAVQSNVWAVLPRTPDGRLQPLCAAYAKAALDPLSSALQGGTRKVTDAIQSLSWRALDMDDASPFANVNRRSDLTALE